VCSRRGDIQIHDYLTLPYRVQAELDENAKVICVFRRELPMTPVSFQQPLYFENPDQSGGAMVTNAHRVPNVYLMSSDDEHQPAAEAGSRRVDA